jgi:hypothetical protein
MTRFKWELVIAVAVGALLLFGYDLTLTKLWIGSTDLEIEFVITEIGSGKGVPGARVEIQSSTHSYETPKKEEFVLIADSGGVAAREWYNITCTGRQSGLRITNTFAVRRPWLKFRVTAAGFEATEWLAAEDLEAPRRVVRTGPRQSRWVIPVELKR